MRGQDPAFKARDCRLRKYGHCGELDRNISLCPLGESGFTINQVEAIPPYGTSLFAQSWSLRAPILPFAKANADNYRSSDSNSVREWQCRAIRSPISTTLDALPGYFAGWKKYRFQF
jgi:hypothetical protein